MSSSGSQAGVDAFQHLGDTVRAALSDRGFSQPTEPQRRAIPPLAAGDNALVLAPTGTGKTETAMLPVFDSLVAHRAAHGATDGFAALYMLVPGGSVRSSGHGESYPVHQPIPCQLRYHASR